MTDQSGLARPLHRHRGSSRTRGWTRCGRCHPGPIQLSELHGQVTNSAAPPRINTRSASLSPSSAARAADPASGRAAASRCDRHLGLATRFEAAATTYSAKVPSDCRPTRPNTSQPLPSSETPAPTWSTTPDRSEPRVNGNARGAISLSHPSRSFQSSGLTPLATMWTVLAPVRQSAPACSRLEAPQRRHSRGSEPHA